MADTETMTIQQRLAMLNLQQVGARGTAGPKKAAPPPPPRLPPRSISTSNAAVIQGTESEAPSIGNQPAAQPPQRPVMAERKSMLGPPVLPRRETVQPQPTAPPHRRTSELTLVRTTSSESIASNLSANSALSLPSTHTSKTSPSRSPSFDGRNTAQSVKAPAYDPTNLPKLPPKRAELSQKPATKRPSFHATSSSVTLPATAQRRESVPAQPPPMLPRRGTQTVVEQQEPEPIIQQQQLPVVPARPRKSALAWGMNQSTGTTPSIPQKSQRPFSIAVEPKANAPPPIPTNSRPSAAQLQTPSVRPAAAPSTQPNTASCLKCRDFSLPDAHAARFNREALPSTDLTWLAQQLTSRFPSHTDKARALFLWLHHNISYNVDAFFSNNVRSSTPSSTISSGLAVCEGYAGLFASLAIASGLEAVVIGGHGKGFGYAPLKPGEAPPPFASSHAWNAVRIDNGEWKLLDACWGAGHIKADPPLYTKHLSAEMFTMDNDEFGLRHFPENAGMFFRSDNRMISWEDYYIGIDGPGEALQLYGGTTSNFGLGATTFSPPKKHIKVRGRNPKERIQFQFSAVCEHFDPVAAGLGAPYPFMLQVGGKDGRKRDYLVCQVDGKGRHWWVDAAVEELGCAGQTVLLVAVTTINGQSARGVSPVEMKKKLGRVGWGSEGVALWQLV